MDISTLTAILPAQITFAAMLRFIGILVAAVFVSSLLFRIILGRRSALNRAVCAGIGVLCIYVLTIIVYTFHPGNLDQFLIPLPFVDFSGTTMYLTRYTEAPFSDICAEILSLIILVLVYNLTDSLLPDGETTLSWILLRSLAIIASMIVHYFLIVLTKDYLPELLVSYGPMILLVCLLTSFFAGILGALLGLVVAVINPILGLLFHFFFSSRLGKELSKSVLTSAILIGLIATLHRLGYTVIGVSAIALLSYIPLLLILVALWWVLERIF